MKTSLERIAPLLAACALTVGVSACHFTDLPSDAGDAGLATDAGRDGGRHDAGPDGGRPDGSSVDTDGGSDDAGCFTNPHTAAEIANRCTTSFRIPADRTPPCAEGGSLPALGTDLTEAGCIPPDGGLLPDGSCYFSDAGSH